MNMSCRVLLTLSLLTAFDSQTAGKLIMKPRDTEIQVNQSTYFNCSTDIASTSIFWYYGKTFVYVGFGVLEPYTERFAIDESEWNGTYVYNLVIHSVKPSDAGEYICSDDEGYGEKYSVQLIVLVSGKLTITPRNTVVLAGERVELGCSVDRYSNVSRWDVTRYSWLMTNKSTVREIETIARFDKKLGLSLVNITHLGLDVDSTGSGIIYYNSTDLEDAGNYTCCAHVGPHKDTIFYSAQLIILEYFPDCTSNYTNDTESSINVEAIAMQCNLNFRGFWSPTMQWTRHYGDGTADGTNREVGGVIENETIPNSRVTSSLTVSRDSLEDGTFFSCRIYFERIFNGSISTTARKFDYTLIMNATNVPDFVYVWNSSAYYTVPSSFKTNGRKDSSRAITYSVIGAAIGFGVVAFVTFALIFYYRREPSGKITSPYEPTMTFENMADDYATMSYATSDHYEEIAVVAPPTIVTSSAPRFSAMAGHSVLSHAESEAPNVYERMSDLNASMPYATPDHYEEIEVDAPRTIVTSSAPRFSAMAGHSVLSHAEPEAPNVYDRMRDINVSMEQYNANEDQDHHISAISGERCYLELQP